MFFRPLLPETRGKGWFFRMSVQIIRRERHYPCMPHQRTGELDPEVVVAKNAITTPHGAVESMVKVVVNLIDGDDL